MIDSLKMQHNYIAFLPSSLKLPPSCWRWYSFLFCSTTDTNVFKNELKGARKTRPVPEKHLYVPLVVSYFHLCFHGNVSTWISFGHLTL